MASEVKNVMYFNDFKILAWSLIISENIWKDMFRNTLNTWISRNKVSDILLVKKLKLSHEYHKFPCNTCMYMYWNRDYELKK